MLNVRVALPGGDFITACHDGQLRLWSANPLKTDCAQAVQAQGQFEVIVFKCYDP